MLNAARVHGSPMIVIAMNDGRDYPAHRHPQTAEDDP
jgi:hypothetical protein